MFGVCIICTITRENKNIGRVGPSLGTNESNWWGDGTDGMERWMKIEGRERGISSMSPLLLLLFFVATVPALCNFWKLFRRHSVKLLFVYFCLPIREDKIVTTCIANWGNKSKRRPPPRQHRWHQRHKHRHWIQKTSTAGRCWMREYRTSFIKKRTLSTG